MPPAYTSPADATTGLTAAFNPTTPEQKTAIANAAALVPTLPQKTSEPTVLTSGNIDDKNQDNLSKMQTKAATGQIAGTDGFIRNADQSFAEAPSDAKQINDESGNSYWSSGGMHYALGPSNGNVSSDPFIQGIYKQFSDLKTQMDATGAALIDNIKKKYDGLISAQQLTNKGAEAGVNSLLTRGGSMQTESSSGIMQSQVSYGLQKISDLTAEENDAVIKAQQAIQDNDYRSLDKMLSIADKARTEKQAAAQKLSDTISTAHKQAQKDTAVMGQLQLGVVDPVKILNNLRAAGNTSITAKDISDALANLRPESKAVADLLSTARDNGAPPEILTAINSATDLNEAYKAASTYGAGGTGMVGEYNRYVADATRRGQHPVDFQTYQDIDANRKAKVAAAAVGNSGLSNQTLTKVQTIAGQFDNEQVVKDYNTVATQVSFVQDLAKTPTDDMSRVYAFAKVMDPNSVVRESEYKTVQDYAQAVLAAQGLKAKRYFTSTGFLTDEARGFINTTLTNRLKTQYKTYKNISDEYGRRINKITGQTDGTDYITDYSKGYSSTGDGLIQTEDQATQALTNFTTAHPEQKAQVTNAVSTLEKSLGRPATAAEFLQAFPEYSK